MCGIGGAQLREGDGDAKLLAQNLLHELTVRGSHASGIAWHENNANQTWVMKHNSPGTQFAKSLKNEQIGNTFIVHTRFATQGHQSNMNNNHPIDVEGIVGVHNGHINNDDELIEKCKGYKRKGKVDSEAAFAYLAHGPKARGLYARLSDISGGAALMWLNSCGPRKILHIVRLSNSPLCFGETEKGSVVVASTKDILLKACNKSNISLKHIEELKEGMYLRFEKGEITQMQDIELPKPREKKKLWWTYPAEQQYVPSFGQYEDGKFKTRMDSLLQELEQEQLDFEADLLADEREMSRTLWDIHYKEGE